MVTSAPGTAAPVGSVTVPRILPDTACACAAGQGIRRKTNHTIAAPGSLRAENMGQPPIQAVGANYVRLRARRSQIAAAGRYSSMIDTTKASWLDRSKAGARHFSGVCGRKIDAVAFITRERGT